LHSCWPCELGQVGLGLGQLGEDDVTGVIVHTLALTDR